MSLTHTTQHRCLLGQAKMDVGARSDFLPKSIVANGRALWPRGAINLPSLSLRRRRGRIHEANQKALNDFSASVAAPTFQG